MPDGSILALDNGIYKIWCDRNYKACQPNTVLLDTALASMGAGSPSAMAAGLGHPDRTVMALCGDGEVLNLEISERARRYRGMTRRVSIGPCSFISPFDFPLNKAQVGKKKVVLELGGHRSVYH